MITGVLGRINAYVLLDNSSLTIGSVSSLGFGGIGVGNGSTLNVRGDFLQGNSGPLALSGGSSAIIGGNLSLGDTIGVTVDGSSLTVWGSYSQDLAQTIVRNGGSLSVGGNFDNRGGFPPSTLSLSGGSSAIVSGDFSNGSFADVAISGSSLAINGNFANASTFNQGVILQNGGLLTVGGTFTNASTTSNLDLLGQGNVASLHAVQNSGLIQVDGGSTLAVSGGGFNNSGGTLNLVGVANVLGGFTNNGGSVIVSPTAILKADTYSQSAGSTDVAGTLVTNSYTQSGGNTTIDSGGLVKAATFTATGGSVTVNGTLDPTFVNFAAGSTLQGTGTIIGNVTMGGTIMPGSAGVPGTLFMNGNYEQTGTGVFTEWLSPYSQAFLNVNGAATLDPGSLLQIMILGNFNPVGNTYFIMGYNSLTGQFSNGAFFVADGYNWDLTYGSRGIDITAVSAVPEPGELVLLVVGLFALGCYAKSRIPQRA